MGVLGSVGAFKAFKSSKNLNWTLAGFSLLLFLNYSKFLLFDLNLFGFSSVYLFIELLLRSQRSQ